MLRSGKVHKNYKSTDAYHHVLKSYFTTVSYLWNFTSVDELDIGNASPTTVHINIQQHSVTQMRKRYILHILPYISSILLMSESLVIS